MEYPKLLQSVLDRFATSIGCYLSRWEWVSVRQSGPSGAAQLSHDSSLPPEFPPSHILNTTTGDW